jgi:hypothetical protein
MRRTRPLWIGKLLRGIVAQAESRKHYKSQFVEFTVSR